MVQKRRRGLFPNYCTTGKFLVEESLSDLGVDPDPPEYPRRVTSCPATHEPPAGDLMNDGRRPVDAAQDQIEADDLVTDRFLHDVIGCLEGFVKPRQIMVGNDSRSVGTPFKRQSRRQGGAEIEHADGYFC